jgi:YhcH/YjgK/YiaL family protein
MIFDRLDNFPLYLPLHPHFADVLAFLGQGEPAALPPGRHEVNDQGAFVLVSEYTTRPLAESFIECHRSYIDIQLLTHGAEGVGICSRAACRELPYDAEKDFLKLEGATDRLTLKAGSFAVFFPDDGHMPMLQLGDQSEPVKKLVFKIPVTAGARS